MSPDDRLLVPDAMSSCSTRAAFSPRLAASSTQPTPVMPPPTTSTSNVSPRRRSQSLARRPTGSSAEPDGAEPPEGDAAASDRAAGRSVKRRRTPADAIQHQRGAQHQDRDHDRRLEDEILAKARDDACDHRQPEHDDYHRRSNQQDVAQGGRPRLSHVMPQARSASAGMPIGATRTRPANAAPRRVRRPVFGRWNVTVRSARTTGSEGSPDVKSTAVGVSTATTGTPALRARLTTSTAERMGSRKTPRTPVPRRASTRTEAFSTPLATTARSRADSACIRVTSASDASRSQLREASGAPGRASVETRTATTRAPARARRLAITNPSPPLFPGP